MQFVASFMESPMAPPSVQAATAIPAPTIARIRAYSAAEAPDWSFQSVFRIIISITPKLSGRVPGLLPSFSGNGGLTFCDPPLHFCNYQEKAIPKELRKGNSQLPCQVNVVILILYLQ